MITQKRLKELLDYDKNTGVFRWKICKAQKIKIGDIAGSLKKRHIRIGIDRRVYRAHRLAWLYIHGELPKNEIDHINHNQMDNRLSNLRATTHTENGKNQGISKNNISGIAGVYWNKIARKWAAQIMVSAKNKHLGYFDDINSAKLARENAKIKYNFHPNHA